ncbi:hypothetical protein CLOM_g6445 [Closterium sp. NIES-68]|nr:hypothetical protein CLOM_g6445 [Closterium sp. NIES-68]
MAPPTLDTPAASSGALPEWQTPPQSFVPDHWAPGLPARASGVGVYGPFVPPRRLAVSPNGVEEGAEAAETGGMESSEEISPGFRAQSRTRRPVGTRSQPGAQEDGLPGRRQTEQVVAVPAATFRRMCQTRRAFGLLAVVVEATHSALLGSESSRKMQHSHLRTSSDALADLVVVMGQALPVPGPGNGLDPAVAAAMRAMSESIALASAVDLAGSCASTLRVLVGLLSAQLEEAAGFE